MTGTPGCPGDELETDRDSGAAECPDGFVVSPGQGG